MDAIKMVVVFRTISSINVLVLDNQTLIDEFEVSHKSSNAYGKVRDFVDSCKDKYIVRIKDEDGILWDMKH